jgi:hypothetical protein
MNELTARLLESAWQDLPAKQRTLDRLKVEAGTDWIIWRNHRVEAWGVEILPYVQRRPAADYYPEAPLGAICIDWLDKHGFYSWEFPIYDGEDDDFVYHFIAHWLAVMAWLAFEPAWDHLDYTEAEVEQFFNFKMNYAPRPPKRVVGSGVQISMF